MGVFDMIESYLVKQRNFNPTKTLRVIVRTGYVGMSVQYFYVD